MRTILAIVALTALCGCLAPPLEQAVPGPELYMVSLPWITLQGGERIAGLKMDLTGARIRAINVVPEDWSVELLPATSGQSVLTLSASHGTAWLRNAYGLGRFLTVTVDDSRHADITTTVRVSGGSSDREIIIRPGDIVLEPLPLR
jgi:hypothetical protein